MTDQAAEMQQPEEAELTRKERNAARRAEFEAKKAAKAAEKAAAKDAKEQETGQKKAEKLAAKEAARAAKKSRKSAGKESSEESSEESSGAGMGESDGAAGQGARRKSRKERPQKPAKDPYRPRFATAPTKVRAFTVLALTFAVVHALGGVLLFLESTSSPVLGVVPDDASALAYVGAALSMLVAFLWAVSAFLLCAGRLLGKRLAVVAVVLGLPLSLVAAPFLFSHDVRDWAL
ncbi:MAG: hypothetical protein KJS90_01405 [Acidobacteria bacterium]|nr:hypothetical protein [Acidobacteriota bacterium]